MYKSEKITEPPCNCSNATKPCPLNGHCLAKNIVYKATVQFEGFHKKSYVGSTGLPFKSRYNNHTRSFRYEGYGNDTALSRYVWEMKNKIKKQPQFKWKIIKRAPTYTTGERFCRLCMEEKLSISVNKGVHSLNKRTEILNMCSHKTGCLLYQVPTSGVT